ncbi:hypothetical protein [Streptomyces sp. NBC_01190]|uniref:hypothetical protein n=1 Tax=Streptomyces sp. NBC_01190 TaxID=2903767 RepID=UPI00386DEC58|nr:hypothetical protein OG519_23195 [Streptomyces sp. NBC_01190]
MLATRKLLATVLVAGAAVAGLTGCGGDKDPSSAAPLVRPISTTTEAGPFAGETGERVLHDAEQAMLTAKSMTIDLHITGDDDEPLHMTAAVTASGKCAAAVDDDGGRFQVIGTGSAYYMKAEAAYWKAKGGANGSVIAQLAGGKWLKLPAGAAKQGGFKEFCDLKTMMTAASQEDAGQTVTKGRPIEYRGQRVLPLTQHSPDDGDTRLYVAATGTPYILFTEEDTSDTGTFSGFGEMPHIAAPPADQTVDFSAFGDPKGFSI